MASISSAERGKPTSFGAWFGIRTVAFRGLQVGPQGRNSFWAGFQVRWPVYSCSECLTSKTDVADWAAMWAIEKLVLVEERRELFVSVSCVWLPLKKKKQQFFF